MTLTPNAIADPGPLTPRRPRYFRLAALVSFALLAGITASSQPATAATAPTAPTYAHACNATPAPGTASCLALIRTDVKAQALAANATPAGHGASDLQSAYKLPSSTAGRGQTVAIVDAFDNADVESDLAVYRAQYGLPACTTANGCFRKVNQSGQSSPLPVGDGGWAYEMSLDVDMVSAACPNCHILVVEASSAYGSDLFSSVNTAVALGAKFVSLSFGYPDGESRQLRR